MGEEFLSGVPDAIFGENRLPDILPTKFEHTRSTVILSISFDNTFTGE